MNHPLANLKVEELEAAWWIWAEVVNVSAIRYRKHPAALTEKEYAGVFLDSLRRITERPGMTATLKFPTEPEAGRIGPWEREK